MTCLYTRTRCLRSWAVKGRTRFICTYGADTYTFKLKIRFIYIVCVCVCCYVKGHTWCSMWYSMWYSMCSAKVVRLDVHSVKDAACCGRMWCGCSEMFFKVFFHLFKCYVAVCGREMCDCQLSWTDRASKFLNRFYLHSKFPAQLSWIATTTMNDNALSTADDSCFV